ncbi:MAG: acid phosphatase [Caulobacter sp.]
MIGRRTLAIGGALALALSLSAGAAPAREERPSGYLAPDALPDSLVLLPPPPAPDSAEAAAERAYFLETRALADTPRWRQAADDAEAFGDKAHAGLACAAGVAITVKDTPTLSRMLDRMTVDAGQSVGGAKTTYNRIRPLVGHDEAPICVPREAWMQTNPSYPSSSAAAGWAWSLVLAELLPKTATPIITRGLAAGESRAICGLHWPSDVTAGRTMGAALVARLHADPAFLKDLETAKTELARSPAPEGCGG